MLLLFARRQILDAALHIALRHALLFGANRHTYDNAGNRPNSTLVNGGYFSLTPHSNHSPFGQLPLFRAHDRRSVDHRLCAEADLPRQMRERPRWAKAAVYAPASSGNRRSGVGPLFILRARGPQIAHDFCGTLIKAETVPLSRGQRPEEEW